MKHGSLTRQSAFAAFLLTSNPTATARFFGARKSDVAVHVGELPKRHGDALVRGLNFSADGDYLAIDSEGSTMDIWNWRSKRGYP